MSKYKDTIYALSTPTGRSAIAVIRISGDQSLNTLKKISSIKTVIPNKTKLTLLKFEKQIIDQVLVVFFKKPYSLFVVMALLYLLEINSKGHENDNNKIFKQ